MNDYLTPVREVLVTILGIENRASSITADSELMDGIPELDSMAIVELVTALEDRFDITIDEDDITGETFETLGTLTQVVADRAGEADPV